MFVLVHTENGIETVCEISGVNCYQVWNNVEGAHAMANQCNATAKENGWKSRYFVSPMPKELKAICFMD